MLGLFSLVRKDSEVARSFQSNDSSDPFLYAHSVDLGNLQLIIQTNEALPPNSFNGKCAVLGSLTYGGKKDEEAAKQILAELNPDWTKAYGNWVILNWASGKVQITLDPLRKFDLYTLNEGELLSNSFFQCCDNAESLVLDQNAFYEKLCRGYNIGARTIYQNIKLLGHEKIELGPDIEVVSNKYKFDPDDLFRSREAAIEKQTNSILEYFEQNRFLFNAEGFDLGISSGYDSRLLLAAITNLGLENGQLHTHAIAELSVHSFDRKVAEELGSKVNMNLKVVETRKFTSLIGSDLDASMKANLNTFQGRNSHNMGALTQTYTVAYKREVLGDKRISLNGLGGEIFRNYYNLPTGFSLRPFMQNLLFYKFSSALVGPRIIEELMDEFVERVSSILESKPDKKNTRAWVRRYYSQIRMPHGDAANHNAYNKHVRFLTPFIEPAILNSAFNIDNHLGIGGDFEGAMIAMLNNELALIRTHYGPEATKESQKNNILNRLKFYLPQRFWVQKFKIQSSKPGFGTANSEFLNHLKNESPDFKKAWDFMTALFPNLNWSVLHHEFAGLANAALLAQSIYRVKHKLK